MSTEFIKTIMTSSHLIIPSVGRRFHLRSHIKPFKSADIVTVLNWSSSEIENNLTSYYFPYAKEINFIYNDKREFNKYDAMAIQWSVYDFPYTMYYISAKYHKVADSYSYKGQLYPISYMDQYRLLKEYDVRKQRLEWLNYLKYSDHDGPYSGKGERT